MSPDVFKTSVSSPLRSIFLHRPDDLDSGIPGGLQLCTREFLEIVRNASDEFRTFLVELSLPLVTRLRKRLCLGSYLSFEPWRYTGELAKALNEGQITHAFLNTADALRFGPLIKKLRPSTTIVLMSHGNQSGDNLYEIAGPNASRSAVSRLLQTWQLGLDLRTESSIRRSSIDVVCTMSEEETVMERWLGARQTFVIPRIVQPGVLSWQPVPGRVGYAGTLSHTPNRVALESVFSLIGGQAGDGVEVRLVGRPEALGRQFAARYPFVHYLGGLSDVELHEEARSWSLFLNPILWLSRGASMKLAQALGWGIPVVTTSSGRRGYRVPDSVGITTPDSAEQFAATVVQVANDADRCDEARRSILEHMPSFPTAASLGRELRMALSAS